MAETALDAVCSRKGQSSNSSYHKGLSPFMTSHILAKAGIYLPLHSSP